MAEETTHAKEAQDKPTLGTPLHELLLRMAKDDIEPKKTDDLDKLSRLGANTKITNEEGWSPLHAASQHGHTEVIRALLAKDRTNIDATESLEGWTALHVAIYYGHRDAVFALLEQGAKLGTKDNDGWTPLMTAIKEKRQEIAKRLLGLGGYFQLETPSESGHTPLMAASINGFSAGASLLINEGADCNVRSRRTKSTPLILASYWGHSGVVEALLRDNQTDVNAQDKDKWTALHEASNKGHSKVVEVLLQRQANVGMGKDDERTPLHLASKKGNEDIVKQLLKAEAKVDVKDKDGKTALHLASGAGPEDYSKHEGERGPDDLSSDERWMAQFCTGQHAAVVKLLLERGAKPDAKTNQNETALHLAAARGDPTRLQHILDKMEPGHISIKNDQGKTALYLACTGDSPKPAVERLLESDKLRTAEFGRSDGEDDEIKWAANYPETHEIAKWLMEERLRRKEMAKPEESDNWSVIGWAAYSQLPEVFSPLIAQSRGSSELQAALESALELTLQSVHKPGEDAEQSKFPEVLSLLIIANSPLKSHIEAVLKEALDLTLGLALVNEVKQGAGHRQLFQVLTLLIATFSGTTEIEKALKSTLELVKTPKEGMTDENLSQVLWLLIANSPPTPDIKEALESSWKSASELLEKTDDQPQDSEAALIPPKISNDEAEASSRKGKNKDQEKPEHKREMSMQTTRAAKDHQTNYRHAIVDILRAPPLLQTHKDGGIDGPPQPNATLLGILGGAGSYHRAVLQG
ncbi:hypothetical protein MRS44_001809 [Fusarium solani]|uniref:uncharacterized protein n=1 Tax=Fusarium solani TaxID=169388 RepID=UPI0032C45613|nr:hypothetical protein MRS44_001809 [Fusarium solani]